jgi:hypothetical protein
MHPAPRGPGDGHEPLEGELLSARGDTPHVADWGGRLRKPLRMFWLVSLGVTGWLVWLTLRGGPTGLMDLLLALLLALPFGVLTLVYLAFGRLLGLMRRASGRLDQHLGAGMDSRDPRMAAVNLRYTLEELRGDAGGLAWLRFMLTPGFFAAVGLSVLATIIMIPVALFTLLLAAF